MLWRLQADLRQPFPALGAEGEAFAAGDNAPPLAQADASFFSFELQRLVVHAHPRVLQQDRRRIDLTAWSPLLYLFRHYYGKGYWLGKSFRAKE